MEEEIKIVILNRDGDLVSDNNQFVSYSFDSQYGLVADAFSVTLADNDADIEVGYEILFLINRKISFRGIIQTKERSWNKDNLSVVLTGKDRGSILVESYCNKFEDFKDQDADVIIDTLIAMTNFYTNEKDTADEADDSTGFNLAADITDRNSAILSDVNESDTYDTVKNITTYDENFLDLDAIGKYKVNPGDKVYDRINDLVKSVGFEILYINSGELYIGDLNKKRHNDTIKYNINVKKSGNGNNALSGTKTEDISGRYSTVSITTQSDRKYWTGSAYQNINEQKIATDSTMPYKKYYHENINRDLGSAENYAIRIREDQRLDGYKVEYTVDSHTDGNGQIWEINRYVNVFDEVLKIYRHLVLYGRTFVFDESSGTRTILRLGLERINELVI
jgi:prophage tail gpP-like protein